MKPLVIVTCFNRINLTKKCIESVIHTTDVKNEIKLVVVNNGSFDETENYLLSLDKTISVLISKTNLGVSGALNRAILLYRQKCQPVVKLDNDVVFLSNGWLSCIETVLKSVRDIGCVIGYCDRLQDRGLMKTTTSEVYEVSNPLGHCCFFPEYIMDRICYFEKFNSEHLYGFEDNLMYVKIKTMGLKFITTKKWSIKSIQEASSLVHKKAHVKVFRDAYLCRQHEIQNNQSYQVSADGRPV